MAQTTLDGGSYEIIRKRLETQGTELKQKLSHLNTLRQEVFGGVSTELIATDRIVTENNCLPRDMRSLGKGVFIFGYNVHMGLRSKVEVKDVFSVYHYDAQEHTFSEYNHPFTEYKEFLEDFDYLYRYYKKTTFVKFLVIGPHLYMAFRVSDDVSDVKVFKWLMEDDGGLTYQGNRSEHEYTLPESHAFSWIRAHRDMQRSGRHPHVSIEDKLFVETVGGDLTIKIEDNTEDGAGIYSEPVENADQTLDDADIHYAESGDLILVKIRPYQEQKTRCFIYNHKVKEVYRVDSIESSCVLLPEDHGVIFADGYYLGSGSFKKFELNLEDMVLERVVASANGEDHLYVFYNRSEGIYSLLPYNVITQTVENPVQCNGFTLFRSGELIYFKSHGQPQKHHSLQIWRTPFVQDVEMLDSGSDHFLGKVGNPEVVRALSACQEILTLINKGESYESLYADIVRQTRDTIDSYFWLDSEEVGDLKSTLGDINGTAVAAIDEFEKVVRIRKSTEKKTREVFDTVRKQLSDFQSGQPGNVEGYVERLSSLRRLRGEVMSLKDLRYAEIPPIEERENEIADAYERTTRQTVEFLLLPDSLTPYEEKIVGLENEIGATTTAAQTRELSEQIDQAGEALEMLIDIVSNLKIEDATQTTEIIDRISSVFSRLNQVKAAAKRHVQEQAKNEGQAQFGAQMKLLGQAIVNYLDVSDSPERCDEYLNKLMVQLEELEGKYAEFDTFQDEILRKREEVYTAFEARKSSLREAHGRKVEKLVKAGDRVIASVSNRVKSFEDAADLNAFFAADLMVEKLRTTIEELRELGETQHSDGLQAKLKTLQNDGLRQLKDKQELYAEGEGTIRLGRHLFSTGSGELRLTMVHREEGMAYHLTGTRYFEEVTDTQLLETRTVWSMETPAENESVYRAEYLAWLFLNEARESRTLDAFIEQDSDSQLEAIQRFMAPRYRDNYIKGVHDHDAHIFLKTLAPIVQQAGLLRYPPLVRACALVFWQAEFADQSEDLLHLKIESLASLAQIYPDARSRASYTEKLTERIQAFCADSPFSPELSEHAAEYLFAEMTDSHGFAISKEAWGLIQAFEQSILGKRHKVRFEELREKSQTNKISEYQIIADWLHAYALSDPEWEGHLAYVSEAAAHLLSGRFQEVKPSDAVLSAELSSFRGNHPAITEGKATLRLNEFVERLTHFEKYTVPSYLTYETRKQVLLDERAAELKLDSFKPRILSSFVRNQLLDQVYLPIIGDNLAKQIGVVGENTRTDRMGLLLLVSPPGYGKTTLMEYVANRLGITFVKINGPAIGHEVTSLDPSEAPNASAREEVERLNLAFEMGDNAMIYLDDIQHCHPEFLQKFISLCDGQRKIEGVFNGTPRNYDLRGRKIAVVMAGNPYTESGAKFQIPDMLANRADTYNLGDIVGGSLEAFKNSYIENSMTSNTVLSQVASRNHEDVLTMIQAIETGNTDDAEYEGDYSGEELSEIFPVLRKLMRIRETILRVNQEYIRSAAQEDAYRTEPPFKLQGSYRNMNRLAEKVAALMTDEEVEQLLRDHYTNESQTLTDGAEANLLKLSQLESWITPEEETRWAEICKTFNRNKLLGGDGEQDPISRILGPLMTFTGSVEEISNTLKGATEQTDRPNEDLKQVVTALETIREHLDTQSKKKPAAPAINVEAPAVSTNLALPESTSKRLDEILTAFQKMLKHTEIEK
ncbi:MAG: DNA repair ATPase [Opitutales bacterium]